MMSCLSASDLSVILVEFVPLTVPHLTSHPIPIEEIAEFHSHIINNCFILVRPAVDLESILATLEL